MSASNFINSAVPLQAVASTAITCHEICLARYAACVKACDEHLSADAPAESPAAALPLLFEGQLSQARGHVPGSI